MSALSVSGRSGAKGCSTIVMLDRHAWSVAACEFLDYGYTQSWHYGVAAAARLGAVSEHVAIVGGQEIIGMADVRIKRLPVIGGGIAYVRGGPLVRRGRKDDLERFTDSLAALRRAYVDERRLVLRILAPIGPERWNCKLAERMRLCGFVPTTARRTYRTILLDLGQPLERIRANLSQRWRRQLSKAARMDMQVYVATDDAAFATFSDIYEDMLERKRFQVDLDARFYADLQSRIPDEEKFSLVMARHRGRTVAGVVVSVLGDTAVFVLGASNVEGRDARAAFVLHWYVVEMAKERRMRFYDLGGIDPAVNQGVATFKMGMGGEDVTAAGPVQAVPNRLSRPVVLTAERIYRWVKPRRSYLQPAPSA